MRTWLRMSVLVLAMIGLGASPAVASVAPAAVEPLRQAHAHNDYEHERPLHDALDHGFTSVEADIYRVGDGLLVAHDPWDVRPERTLEALYLDPLRQLVADNGGVYPGYRGFQLLVDIKTDGEDAYARLDAVLRDPRYQGLFTHYVNGKVEPGPVTVVISGNRPREVIAGQPDRFAFYDGSIDAPEDLGGDPGFAPLVSADWTKQFSWNGSGAMPTDQRDRLRAIIAEAHAAGQRVRFWATPDAEGPEREAVWRELLAAEVDHINTDDLAGLENFLRQ